MAQDGVLANVPTVDAAQVPWLSETQMIEVDRIMIEDLNIGLFQMMENAGRHLARVVMDGYQPSSVIVMAGTGGNGGGGLVAARNLANWLGPDAVSVELTKEPAEDSVPGRQLDIIRRMGVECRTAEDLGNLDPTATLNNSIWIDAVIGYSLRGAPTGKAELMIARMNASDLPVVALDTPSGLNVTDGSTPGACVLADATVTLAAPKAGLRSSTAVGQLFMADISVPPPVYAQVGASAHPGFARGSVVAVSRR